MKKILPLLLLTFLFFDFKGNAQVRPIIFSGIISNPLSKEFFLVKSGAPFQSIPLAADGSFKVTINSGTGQYVFHDGRGRIDLLLIEGDSVNVTLDAKRFGTSAKITGDHVQGSQYLITKPQRLNSLRGSYENFYAKNESEFTAHAKKLRDNLYGLLDSLKNIPESFSKNERKELHYNYLLNLATYEEFHARYTKQPDFKVSANFLSKLKEVDMANEADYKTFASYKKLIPAYHQANIDKLIKEGMDYNLAKIKVYVTIPNDYIKNDLINSTASSFSSSKNIEAFYKAFLAASTSTINNDKLTQKYEQLKKIAPGNPSPIFTNYINDAGGKTSFSDLKGKYIYIDVWATWCMPCLAELPSLKKVEEKYHGKNIHFLSISVDQEAAYANWKKMVNSESMGGIQLFADKSFKSDFMTAFDITFIPRFILIDPNGNIVSANAPRPSDPKLISLFKELEI